MASDIVDVRFPLAGVSRNVGFQSAEMFTCRDALNVRAKDVFEARLRGGSRPGLAKAFTDLLGSGNPVRLLNSVLTGQEIPDPSTANDTFGGSSLNAVWSAWTGFTTGTVSLPTVESGRAVIKSSGSNKKYIGAIRDAISYDTDADIEIETEIYASASLSPNMRTLSSWGNAGLHWQIAFGLQNAADYSGGLVIDVHAETNGAANLELNVYNQGSLLLNSNGFNVEGHVVRVVVIPGGTVRIYWGTPNNLLWTINGVTLSGNRVAFSAWRNSNVTVDAGFNYFNFKYTLSSAATPIAEPALVASSNGLLYYEDSSGSIAQVTGQDVDLASDRLLSSTERFGKLYIADYELIAEGTAGITADTGGDTNYRIFSDTAVVTDWSTLLAAGDIDADYVLEIFAATGDTSDAANGQHTIATVGTTTLTLTTEPFNAALSAIEWRVVRCPKVFDYRLTGSGKLVKLTKNTAAASTVKPPVGCTIAAVWMDRLCLSGDPKNPGDTFMSKQGDPTWWTEDSTSALSAIFGEFDTNTRINEPVTALIPFVKDYLIIGGISTISVLRGNPVLGGTVDFVSRDVGIVDKFAHCMTPENILLVMTGDGLYAIGPDAAYAEPVSRNSLPREFIGIDTINNDVQMAFDLRRNGVHIAITPKTAAVGQYYWFDWQTKGFWPDAYASDFQPTAMTVYTQSGESTPTMIWGGRDGYLREFVDSQYTDDSTNFDSYVLIGPIMLGAGGYNDGMIREVVGQLATVSGSAKVAVQVGNSIEDAYRATPRDYYTMRAGKGLSNFPRLRGNCCYLRVEGIPGTPWALEILTLVREQFGKQRLLA